jgi:two-component system sensor histidine kinase UhpB
MPSLRLAGQGCVRVAGQRAPGAGRIYTFCPMAFGCGSGDSQRQPISDLGRLRRLDLLSPATVKQKGGWLGPMPTRLARPVRLSLLQRAALANAAVLLLAFILLALSPVTISAPIRGGELIILVAGLVAMLIVNLVLIRRALAPLEDLAAEMETIDLRDRRGQIEIPSSDSTELATFTGALNDMVNRLAEERRLGARAALSAQERERLRIARALHDEAGQTLTAVALEIERAAEAAEPEDRQRLTALAAELHSTLDEIRRITRELRPEALDDLGLINALIALCRRSSQQGGIQIEQNLGTDLPPLSPELELVIYRVAQEALTNILRHSGASRCSVSLARAGQSIELTIDDDGSGLPEIRPEETVGIEGMRERALLARGRLELGARAGGGTRVRLLVPIEEDPGEED